MNNILNKWDYDKENDNWIFRLSEESGYHVIDFKEYFGLYYYGNNNSSKDGYLTKDFIMCCGPGLAAAIGLPNEAQFKSIEEIKKYIENKIFV